MKVEKFGLEQVLNYRREIENVRKQDFVSARSDFEHASDVLSQHQSHADRLSEEFSTRQSDLRSIEEIRSYSNYFARKREVIRCQREVVDTLGSIMNDRRDELLDATKDKKVLESLKEKKAQEFRLEMAQKERAFLDEISIQRKTAHCE